LGLDFSPWGELFVANFMGAGGVSRFTFDPMLFTAIPNGSFPTPVTLGDLQFLPNVPGVRGVVLDAASDQPLAGVTVQAIIGNTSRQLTTRPDGRFEIDGLPAGQAQISFTLTGYLTQNFALQLSTLTDIDIGAVRLRKNNAATLLPDLVVRSVDTQQVASDPRTFALSGSLNATIANQGTAPTTAGFKVRAFYDANRNGVYDAGVDVVLGEGQTGDALVVNATVQVSIPLSGALLFRDAPIQVWADSDQSVVETNELNNVSNLYIGNDGVTYTKIAAGMLTESPDPALNSAFVPILATPSTFRFVKYEVVGGSHWSHLQDLEILTQQQAPAVTASDLSASSLRLTDLGSGQLRLSGRIGNGGAVASPASSVSFYDGDPAQGGALLASAAVVALQP